MRDSRGLTEAKIDEMADAYETVGQAVADMDRESRLDVLTINILDAACTDEDLIRSVIHDLQFAIGDEEHPRTEWTNPNETLQQNERIIVSPCVQRVVDYRESRDEQQRALKAISDESIAKWRKEKSS